MVKPREQHRFYGTSTVGEKGQVVIPAEGRTALKLKKGEKLLVFGMGDGMVVLSKLENLEKITAHLTSRLAMLQRVLKRSNQAK